MQSVSTAIILCAGRGTRLRPHTDTTPKPLLPVNGKPTLFYILKALHLAGCKRVCLVTHYLSEQIEAYASEQTFFDKHAICCVRQDILSGTADAALAALTAQPEWFEQPFLLTASDYIVPDDFYKKMVDAHLKSQKQIVVSVKAVDVRELSKRSSVRFNSAGDVLEIVEKPKEGKAPSNLSANLAYILPPNIVPMIASVAPSVRGEKEVQAAVNVHLAKHGVGCAVESPAPPEWQAPHA